MKPKTIKKLLSVVLSLVMILGLATNASSTKAESISFNNYLSSVTIDGSDASEIEELKADSTHTLELKTDAITISDLTGAGDYEISLPDGIAVENIASTDIYASIDGNSTKVGSYTVSSNKINITLDNLISEDENGEVTTDVNTTSSYSFTLDVTMNATFDGTTTSFKFSDSITKTVSYYVEETTTDNETEEDNTTSNNLLGSSKTSDADAVQALIDALPDVSELASMTTNELNEVNTALDAANDAYYELSDEDQALVDDSKLAELYNYFSGAISTVDDSGSNSITTVDATSYFNSATSTATVNSTSTFIDQTASSSTITTSSGDATTIIENGESYQIIFNLEFVDGTVSTNTVYTIDLSEISKYLNIDTSDIPTSASEAGTITYGEIVIGYWYLGSDNKIYFVFNDNVDGKDDGWVEIKLNATGSSDGSESDSKDIKVDLGTDTWEGTYVKSESSLNVEKTVDSTTVTEDNGNEAGTYTYSVKITSTGTNDLTSLQDYFKESWRSDSYKLLSYTGDGSDITVTVYNSDNTESATLTSGTDYTLSYTNDDSGNGYGNGYIQINFTDGYTLTDGQYIIVTYTLTYDPTNVTVTMDEITNYNKATVSYENNKDEDKSTDDDYTSKTSINHGTVEKDGKKSDDSNSVTWTVTAKKGNSSTDYLNNYVLQDDGTTGMDIDYTKEYSVTIYFTNGDSYPLTDSDAQNFISAMVSTSGVKISDYLTGTTYADLDVEKVIVVYTTTDDGTTYQNQTYTASNTVEIDKDGTKVDEDTEGIDDVGNHVDQGTIDKELVSVNQLTNTVSWKTTITVYPTGTLLYCFDELGTWNSGGHALSTDASDYKATYTYYDDTEGKEVSKVLTLGNDYTISFDGTTKYTIDFTPDIVNSTSKNITIVIEYTTTYTDYLSEGTQISNKGTAYFENETEYDEDNTVIYMMIDKSVSSTDEESGTITWNITVDIFEILDKYYIYDKDTDTYTLSLPTTITIQDTLPKGTELTSNIVTLSGNGFWEFGNWSSSDKQITVTSTSGTITIDLTSTLTKLFTSNYLSAYLADSKTGNTYARFLTLTYSTVVTDYAAYLAGGEQEFANSAQLYGDDLLGQDEETTKMTGESYLGKSGTDQKNGYYLFTVDGIAELVTAYANSSSYDKDSTNWTTVTLTDVYGADLQYNSSFSPTYTVNGTSSTIYLEGNEPDSSGTYVTYSIDESTHTITFNIPYSIATQLESISYYLKVLATTSDDLSQLSLTNTIYLEGQSDTAADTTVDGISSGSGVTGGYTSVLFHITKTDSDTGDALGGAKFTIYEADYDETSGFSYDKDSVVDSGTTLSSDGKLTLSNLTVNKLYAVVETGSPSGYVDISTVYYVIFVKSEDTVNSNYGDSLLQIVSDTFIIKTISSSESGTTVSITQDVTNTQVDSGELTITKSITDNNEIDLTDTDTLELLKGSTITITNTDDGTEYSIDLYELYVTNGGSKTYTLPLGTYTVSETGTVCGYTYTTSYTATVSGDATKTSDQTVTLISDDDSATVEITNTFTKTTKTSIDVTKVWNDKGLSHSNDSITVYLIVNGTPDSNNTLVLSESNNWSGTFDDLDVYDNNGSPITYSVGESTSSIKEGYSISLSGNMTDGYVITNTLQTSLTVTKSWNDSAVSSSRPSSITVQLYQNGETYGNSVTLSGDDWEYTYTKLPMYNEKGIAYTYTIEEVGETSGLITYGDNTYTVEYDQSNYIITNTITGTTEVTGTKTWNDEVTDHETSKEITLILSRKISTDKDYAEVDSSEYTLEWNGDSYTFKDLVKYDGDGNTYTYKITEDTDSDGNVTVNGNTYTVTYSGNDITNTITGTTEVTGIKTWDDNNNQDGIRPASIIVRLLQNNNEIDSIVVNADENGNWTYSFDNLNKYDSDGELYEYTVTEDAVSDYTTTFDGYNITNTHTPETKEITINKTWSDCNDADGTRPDSVTVHLYKTVNDVITEVGNGYEVKASENWTLTIPNLPVYENGVEIEYSITEDEVEGYTTDINEFAITNTYTTSASVSGTKTWVDSNDLYNTRPESIIITLLKDGVEYGSQEVSADANGDWTYSFINLEKYNEDGSEIKYTIKEVAVDGYTSVVDGYDITNTLVTGNLTIKKISNGTETPDDAIFTIYDSEGNAITEIKYSEFTKGSFTLENIAVGTYTVVESNADMDGYDLEVIVSSSDVTIENDSESTITFTNTYSQIQTEEGNDTDDSSSEEEVVSENETGIQTGDDSNVLGYSILAIAALAFIAIFRKRRYE